MGSSIQCPVASEGARRPCPQAEDGRGPVALPPGPWTPNLCPSHTHRDPSLLTRSAVAAHTGSSVVAAQSSPMALYLEHLCLEHSH